MKMKPIVITERLREVVNEFLGTEFIPPCAIGNELAYMDGSLVVKTFGNTGMNGWRRLGEDGEITNIIAEFFTNHA